MSWLLIAESMWQGIMVRLHTIPMDWFVGF